MYFKKNLHLRLQGAGVVCALLFTQGMAAQELSGDSTRQPTSPSVNLHYQSPLAGYQRYTHSSIQSWQRANLTAQKTGGWKSQSKEAASRSASPAEVPSQHSTPMGHSHEEHE